MKADLKSGVARREVPIASFTLRGQTRLVDNLVVDRKAALPRGLLRYRFAMNTRLCIAAKIRADVGMVRTSRISTRTGCSGGLANWLMGSKYEELSVSKSGAIPIRPNLNESYRAITGSEGYSLTQTLYTLMRSTARMDSPWSAAQEPVFGNEDDVLSSSAGALIGLRIGELQL